MMKWDLRLQALYLGLDNEIFLKTFVFYRTKTINRDQILGNWLCFYNTFVFLCTEKRRIFFSYFIFLLVTLALNLHSLNAQFCAFKSLGFIQVIAVIIENAVSHICLQSEVVQKQKFIIIEQNIFHWLFL